MDYVIKSECASDHWRYFDVSGHTVLDLGCGRSMEINDEISKNEYTPFYFASKNAKKVIGVDQQDLDYFINETKNLNMFDFIALTINTPDKIKELINKYSITAIKSDIEGDELSLLGLSAEDLNNVSEIAIEFHGDNIRDLCVKRIKEWGFIIKVFAFFEKTNSYGVLFCSKNI